MILKKLTPLASLNKAYQKLKPQRNEFERFKTELQNFFNEINLDESEEHNKKYITDLLEKTFYSNYKINTKYRTDLAVYLGKSAKDKVGVILEVKHPNNKGEMIKPDNLNAKAMHEAMRYYFSERIDEKNDEIKSIVITNLYEWFIFDAQLFERIFYKNSGLKKNYESWKSNSKVSSNTEHFYNEIAKPFLENLEDEIPFTYFNLKEYKLSDEKKLIPLFKLFSPEHLLKVPFANDSNTLNKPFYQELLYLIGLEEVKEGSKKIIRRKDEKTRNSGSLLENTITILKSKDSVIYFNDKEKYGSTKEEQLFNIALELNITWINRILFLKLLEAQIISYHKGDKSRKFLDSSIILDFDILHELFHEVLAVKIEDRNKDILEHFKNVPYLNSSLFDISRLERKTINISELKNRYKIPYYNQTVIKENGKRKTDEVSILKYLLDFLDAYDFASESTGDDIQEENKSLINASVLGRIFEKINGYKEGSIFTPGFITMYMSRETIRRAVVQKFNDHLKTTYKDFNELSKEIDKSTKGREEANQIINSLKICDPAVGSGHFLVSALNEIIAVKSELGVLNYRDGSRFQEYKVEIENDELIVTNKETEEIFEYHLNDKGNPVEDLQKVQEALFHEKETIIENCLFGVDINPNSVNICRLRLWIELLKNSYYTPLSSTRRGAGGEVGLQTLPNIDINIKQGNSLISRFRLDDSAADLPMGIKNKHKRLTKKYKDQVIIYKTTQDKNVRRDALEELKNIKAEFEKIADPNDKDIKRMRVLEDKLMEQVLAFDKESVDAWNEKREVFQRELESLREKYILKQKSIYESAFEWRFEFPEVLDDDGNFVGFDVVIGNPPYMSGRDGYFNEHEKNYYVNNYQTAEYQLDSYVLFIEKAKHIGNSIFSLIVPNTWLSNIRLVKVRKYLVNYCNISALVIMPPYIFDDAVVDTVILKANQLMNSKMINIYNYDGNEIEHFNKLTYENIKKNKDYDFNIHIDEVSGNILSKMETKSFKLQDICKINRGVHAYRKDGYGKSKFTNGFQTEKDYLEKSYHARKKINTTYFPEVRGKNIFPYFYTFDGNYISYGDWLAEPRSFDFFSGDRIYLRKIVGVKLYSCLVSENVIADQSVYIAKLTNSLYTTKFLLALLNSKLMVWYFRNKHNEFDTLFPQIKVTEFKLLPIIKIIKQESQITELVDQILTKKKSNPEADITVEEKEIDRLVYELYGLTEEEIKIVEGNGE